MKSQICLGCECSETGSSYANLGGSEIHRVSQQIPPRRKSLGTSGQLKHVHRCNYDEKFRTHKTEEWESKPTSLQDLESGRRGTRACAALLQGKQCEHSGSSRSCRRPRTPSRPRPPHLLCSSGARRRSTMTGFGGGLNPLCSEGPVL